MNIKFQNTLHKSDNYSITKKYAVGVKWSLHRHLRFTHRCCCRLVSTSQTTAKSIAKVIIVVGLLRLGDAHIHPARTTVSSAKAMRFSSDQWFLMPRNVWSCLGGWSGDSTQKNGPKGWCVCLMCRRLSLICCNRSDHLPIFSLFFCFQFPSLLCFAYVVILFLRRWPIHLWLWSYGCLTV